MRNRAPRGRRRAALAAAGLLAAGALSGCQSGSAPYAYSGVARGDVGLVPTSPAFAQVAAGQRFPADLKYVPGAPTTVIPSPRSVPADCQPVVGSGGVVYSASRSPGAGSGSMPGAATAPGSPGLMAASSTVALPTVPTVASVPAPAGAWTGGQQTILLVNGPNGPQYVIAEVLGSAPAPMPNTSVAPATTAVTNGPPAASAPPTPLPTVASVAPIDRAPAPTFNPPPPPAIPMPPPLPTPAPAVVPVEISRKTPDPLPPAIKSPPDPVLPVSAESGPSPDSSPPGTFRPAKLPKATAVTDDDIPPAPAFLPVPK
jgi:hypothetical protein